MKEKKILECVEKSIYNLVEGFIKNPYLHRCEHSLHCELFSLIKESDDFFKELHTIGTSLGDVKTQLIHKEWPEWEPRKNENGKNNRRGNFDIVVLTPTELEKVKNLKDFEDGRIKPLIALENVTNLKDFEDGRIKPLIAIEIGLNYDKDHLNADIKKLGNSDIQYSYIIHLSNKNHRLQTITNTEDEIKKEKKNDIKISYANVINKGNEIITLGNIWINGDKKSE